MNTRGYLSTYLNTEDFPKPRLLKVRSVNAEQIDSREKIVIYFSDATTGEDLENGLPLARTTIMQLEEIFSSRETNDWIGRKVVAFLDASVLFQGKKVGGIRFRPSRNPEDNVAPVRVPVQDHDPAKDDNIPF